MIIYDNEDTQYLNSYIVVEIHYVDHEWHYLQTLSSASYSFFHIVTNNICNKLLLFILLSPLIIVIIIKKKKLQKVVEMIHYLLNYF